MGGRGVDVLEDGKIQTRKIARKFEERLAVVIQQLPLPSWERVGVRG
jgi:hypothetical protein